jgi:hypothetical protein
MQTTQLRMVTATVSGFVLGLAVLSGCAGTQATAPATPATPPQALTVPEITQMIEQGEAPAVVIGEIERTGTVYRLTPEQQQRLRADGSPASLLSFMQLTYVHATEQNPALATSDAEWHRIGEYWYGGTPFGWPTAWVIGAPRLGEALRQK